MLKVSWEILFSLGPRPMLEIDTAVKSDNMTNIER